MENIDETTGPGPETTESTDACMGILLRLDLDQLANIRAAFEAHSPASGLTLDQFVDVMLQHLPQQKDLEEQQDLEEEEEEEEDRTNHKVAGSRHQSLIMDLIELFHQVDVNGDNLMEWHEFTTVLAESGVTTSERRSKHALRHLTLREHPITLPQAQPRRIKYLSSPSGFTPKIAITCEHSPRVSFYDPQGFFSAETTAESSSSTSELQQPRTTTLEPLVSFKPLAYLNSSSSSSSSISSGNNSSSTTIRDLELLCPAFDMVALSPGDLTLTFWPLPQVMSSLDHHRSKPASIVKTSRSVEKLLWHNDLRKLFGIDASNEISIWDITLGNSRTGNRTSNPSSNKPQLCISWNGKIGGDYHQDIVRDISVVSPELQLLASASMDGSIGLWDMQRQLRSGERLGHRQGVRSLCGVDGQRMLFCSGGTDGQILGWETSGRITSPLFQLVVGNSKSPVTTLMAVPHEDQLMSVDAQGNLRWWNIQQHSAMQDEDRCLQVLRLGETIHDVCVIPALETKTSAKTRTKSTGAKRKKSSMTTLVAGRKVRQVNQHRLKSQHHAPTTVLYNATSMTLLTTSDADVAIWDAVSGKRLRTYRNISSSKISHVALDARERKFVIGNQTGEMLVFDYLNGSKLKTLRPGHQAELSGMIYNRPDKCLITCAWDKSLRVYEDSGGEDASLLRLVTDAHECDILELAFSHAFGLIVTTASDGLIRIWDFMYLTLEGQVCCPVAKHAALVPNGVADVPADAQEQHESSSRPLVTCLAFFEPYPILISGHVDGRVHLWSIRTYNGLGGERASYTLLASFDNAAANTCPIQTLFSYYDEQEGDEIQEGVSTGRHVVVVADEAGFITLWNISAILHSLEITATPVALFPHQHKGTYNPRRKGITDGKSLSFRAEVVGHPDNSEDTNSYTGPTPALAPLALPPPQLIRTWKAHEEGILSIHPVVDLGGLFFTCSQDQSVKGWNVQGQALGSLTRSRTRPTSDTSPNVNPNVNSPGLALGLNRNQLDQDRRECANEMWTRIRLKRKTERVLVKAAIDRRASKLSIQGLLLSNSSSFGTGHGEDHHIDRGDPLELVTRATSSAGQTRSRLFQQLSGQETWTKSKSDLAVESALVEAKRRYRERMLHFATLQQKQTQGAQYAKDAKDSHDEDLLAFPTLSRSNQRGEVGFEDADNWTLQSLNRQQQLYSNLYQELHRVKRGTTSNNHHPRHSMIDTSLSPFLLQKLGPDVVPRTRDWKKNGKQLRKKNFVKHSNNIRTLEPLVQLPGTGTTSGTIGTTSATMDIRTTAGVSREEESVVAHRHHRSMQALERKQSLYLKDYDKTLEATSSKFSKSKLRKPAQSNSSSHSDTNHGQSHASDTSTVSQDVRIMSQTHFGIYPREEILALVRVYLKLDFTLRKGVNVFEFMKEMEKLPFTWILSQMAPIITKAVTEDEAHLAFHELFRAIFSSSVQSGSNSNSTNSQTRLADILTFAEIYQKSEQSRQLAQNSRQVLSVESLADLEALFQLYDTNRSGSIDPQELLQALGQNRVGAEEGLADGGLNMSEIKKLIQEFDTDANAELDKNEFIELFRESFQSLVSFQSST